MHLIAAMKSKKLIFKTISFGLLVLLQVNSTRVWADESTGESTSDQSKHFDTTDRMVIGASLAFPSTIYAVTAGGKIRKMQGETVTSWVDEQDIRENALASENESIKQLKLELEHDPANAALKARLEELTRKTTALETYIETGKHDTLTPAEVDRLQGAHHAHSLRAAETDSLLAQSAKLGFRQNVARSVSLVSFFGAFFGAEEAYKDLVKISQNIKPALKPTEVSSGSQATHAEAKSGGVRGE